MPPGGYSVRVKKKYQQAKIRGFGLPLKDGGHELLLDMRQGEENLTWIVTPMLPTDIGLVATELASRYPMFSRLKTQRLLGSDDMNVDIVLYGGSATKVFLRHVRTGRLADLSSARLPWRCNMEGGVRTTSMLFRKSKPVTVCA